MAAWATIALGAALAPVAALAECEDASNALTLVHFETGAAAIPGAAQEKLEQFASTAKFKDAVCIRAQVDAQGGESAANVRLAERRAENIKRFLIRRGVREAAIEIQTQGQGFTLWGLLEDDQAVDRVVRLTHD